MRKSVGLQAALLGGSACLFFSAAALHAQAITNPNFELPSDGATGTDSVATGWTLDPAIGDAYTNPGQRCQFGTTPQPDAPGTWSFWLQTFVQSGDANQSVPGIVAGTNYNFSSYLEFQTPGYDNTTLANQAADKNVGGNGTTANTQNVYSYLRMTFENTLGVQVGTSDELDIPAGGETVVAGAPAGSSGWAPYTVSGVAPAGATRVLISIGWNDGGLDGNTGNQSGFATDTALTSGPVPEPATLSLLGMGAMGLLVRRRRNA